MNIIKWLYLSMCIHLDITDCETEYQLTLKHESSETNYGFSALRDLTNRKDSITNNCNLLLSTNGNFMRTETPYVCDYIPSV